MQLWLLKKGFAIYIIEAAKTMFKPWLYSVCTAHQYFFKDSQLTIQNHTPSPLATWNVIHWS